MPHTLTEVDLDERFLAGIRRRKLERERRLNPTPLVGDIRLSPLERLRIAVKRAPRL